MPVKRFKSSSVSFVGTEPPQLHGYGGRVTARDLDALEDARSMRDRHGAGLMPDSIGDLSRYRKLVRLGLMKVFGYCRHIDTGREGWGFTLTDDGEQLLAYRDAVPRMVGAT